MGMTLDAADKVIVWLLIPSSVVGCVNW